MRSTLARFICLVLCLALLPLGALADRGFIIADSGARLLTEEELWTWDYESLGYILNEIFARHGYVFISGGQYDRYFSSQSWYQPVYSENNEACYRQLTSVEWANEQLVKDVRAQMRAAGTTNPEGKSLWDAVSAGFDTLMGFTLVQGAAPDQRLPVYAAPGPSAWRGVGGKAMVSTNGPIYAAGWYGNWLLVMYETNNGSVRVGYVNGQDMTVRLPVYTSVSFEDRRALVLSEQDLTDDPARRSSTLRVLRPGEEVIYLGTYYNRQAWDFVETWVDNKPAHGFIRSGSLYIEGMEEPGSGK